MEYLPLACFGKAPCDLEYLEYNVSYPTSRKLKTWIRDGFKTARLSREGDGKSRPFRESNGSAFLLGGADSGEWVAGTVGPSTDQYPRENVLALFTHIPRRFYGKAYHLLPMALAQVWNAVEDARRHLLEVGTLDAFEDYLLQTRVPAPEASTQSKSDYKRMQKETVERIFQRSDGARIDELQRNLPQVVKQLRAVKGQGSMAVELPVSTDPASACFDVSFWIDLFNRQFLWQRFHPAVFLDVDPRAPDRSVTLIYGTPEPRHYAPIMGDPDPGSILRPAGGSRHAAAGAAAAIDEAEASMVEQNEPEPALEPEEIVVPDPALALSYEEMLGRKISQGRPGA